MAKEDKIQYRKARYIGEGEWLSETCHGCRRASIEDEVNLSEVVVLALGDVGRRNTDVESYGLLYIVAEFHERRVCCTAIFLSLSCGLGHKLGKVATRRLPLS